jgi:hypothetical protein
VHGVRILLRVTTPARHGRGCTTEAAPDAIAPERGRPPLNAARYCSPEAPPVIESQDDLELRWDYEEETLRSVEIVLEGRGLARLAPGARPGWSRFAAVDGPCARALR